MASSFGHKPKLVFTIGPSLKATTVAVNQDWYVLPDFGCAYEVESVVSTQSVASTSGTLKIRVITDTTAPGAAASSTCVELVSAISTASTANTPVTATKVAGERILPGNRIASLSGGTQTNLVGFAAVVTLRPVVESGS
jgi:hypothetical protein